MYFRVAGELYFARLNVSETYAGRKKPKGIKNRNQRTFKKIHRIVPKKKFSPTTEFHTLQLIGRVWTNNNNNNNNTNDDKNEMNMTMNNK